MKQQLLASAPTLDDICDCIADFYGGERKRLGRVDSTVTPVGP